MAKHMVKCFYCGKLFDASSEPFVMARTTRYAHKACAEEAESKKTKEQKDKEELEKYICNLFGISCISAKIRKQIKTYREENNYSYSAIRKTLIYFFEVRGNSIEKANEGIGIVEWVIAEASKYWKGIEKAQQKNENKEIEPLSVREVHIHSPRRNPIKKFRNTFTFLEEEVENS